MGKITMTSRKADVVEFLGKMNNILSRSSFSIDRDFVFQQFRESDQPDDEYTNENTLLELEYNTSDVIEELKTLTVKNYSESIVDNRDTGFNVFYVFGKVIKGREVYIKVRIKQRANTNKDYVFCISFHFARHPIAQYPYK